MDGVFFVFIQFSDLFDFQSFTVNTDTGKALFYQSFEKLVVDSLLAGYQR